MVVEDTPLICQVVSEMLTREGYTVECRTHDFAALLAPGPWEGVDVAVVDIMLNGVSGADVLAYLTATHPTVRRVAFTAKGDTSSIPGGLYDALVQKPATPAELLEAVRGA